MVRLVVGSCQLQLPIPGSTSLKDKRRVVKGICERARRRFNVSVAEVDRVEDPTVATLGIAYVSNRREHARRVLEQVVQWVQGHSEGDVVVIAWDV